MGLQTRRVRLATVRRNRPRVSVAQELAPAQEPQRRSPFVPRRYVLSLAAALADSRVEIRGNVFWVTAASSASAVATVKFVYADGSISDAVDVAQGFRIFGSDYSALLFTCAAQVGASLTITYGDDESSRFVEGDTI